MISVSCRSRKGGLSSCCILLTKPPSGKPIKNLFMGLYSLHCHDACYIIFIAWFTGFNDVPGAILSVVTIVEQANEAYIFPESSTPDLYAW